MSTTTPYVIGITGGIGSGKTTVSDHFAKLGAGVIDTDILARQIVEPGQPALEKLVAEFGRSILLKSGHLDRAQLRTLAFSSKHNKATLDEITHPAIRAEVIRQIATISLPYCLVVVPLLNAESPFFELMKRILVVIANDNIKIERVQKRSGLSNTEVQRIMQTQLRDDQRILFADDIIENNSSLEHVYRKVEELHTLYLSLSASK